MERKFQVFLSSTFVDLQKERNLAVSAIMRMSCIPIGMELFPASDQSQWAIIENSVRESDYYVLIVGGRYGSQLGDRSYTQAEYELAAECGVPIIPLLHKHSESLFRTMANEPEMNLEKLLGFRSHLSSTHTCQYWESEGELSLVLYQGLHDAIQRQPRIGWVRADRIASDTALQRLVDAETEAATLRDQLASFEKSASNESSDLAQGDDLFELRGMFKPAPDRAERPFTNMVSWKSIIRLLGPQTQQWTHFDNIRAMLGHLYYLDPNTQVLEPNRERAFASQITPDDVHAILNQLTLLGLMERRVLPLANKTGSAPFWRTTASGDAAVASMLAIRRP